MSGVFVGSYHRCHVSHLEFGVVLAEITVSTESPLVYRQVCWTSAMIAGQDIRLQCAGLTRDDPFT